MSTDLDGAMRASAPAFFNRNSKIGDTISGKVVSASVEQKMEFKNGERTDKPATWDNGDPMNQIRVVLETALRENDDDDGLRSVFYNTWGAQKAALLDAVKAAGFSKLSDALAPGNILTDRYDRDEQGKAPSPAKIHEVRITPAGNASLDAVAAPESTPAPTPAPPSKPKKEEPAPGGSKLDDARELIKLGLTDEDIAESLGMVALVVSKLREQEVAPY